MKRILLLARSDGQPQNPRQVTQIFEYSFSGLVMCHSCLTCLFCSRLLICGIFGLVLASLQRF